MAALILSVATQARAAAEAQPCSAPTTVRVGVVAFHKLSGHDEPDTLLGLATDYLKHLSARSAGGPPFACPVEFELYRGNYYQIYEWMRSEQLDAAIVSPFVTFLLLQRPATSIVAEFVEGQGSRDTYTPVVAARTRGVKSATPAADLDSYLGALLEHVVAGVERRDENYCISPQSDPKGYYRFDAVSHLSTSGFVQPLLYAREFVRERTDNKPLDDEGRALVEREFMRCFVSATNFTLVHDSRLPRDDALNRFVFGYRKTFSWNRSDVGPSEVYGGRLRKPLVEQPPDALVVRDEVLERVLALGDGNQRADWPNVAWPREPNAAQNEFAYRTVRAPDLPARAGFEEAVRYAFDIPSTASAVAPTGAPTLERSYLSEQFETWYERGRYDFSLDNTVELLSQDQNNSGQKNLALVLPGGGVKASYQAIILDYFYQQDLRNRDANNYPGDGEHRPRLLVETVAGTSGGAMLGLFAARLQHDSGALSELWMKNDSPRVTSGQVFPFWGLMRVLGTFVWGVLLLILLLARFWLDSARWTTRATGNSLPKFVGLMFLLILVAVPLGVTILRSAARRHIGEMAVELEGYTPAVEAFLYVCIVGLAHFAWVCCEHCEPRGPVGTWRAFGAQVVEDVKHFRTHTSPERYRRRILVGTVTAGVLLALLGSLAATGYIGFERELSQFPVLGTVWWPSIGFASGLTLISIAITLWTLFGTDQVQVRGSRDYAKAVALVAATLLLSTGLMWVAAWVGFCSFLELTWEFWVYSVVVGFVVILAMLVTDTVLVWRGRDGMHQTLLFLVTPRRSFGTAVTPIGSLVVITATSWTLWLACVSPALYESHNARRFFSELIRGDEQGETLSFTANLVVTGSSLKPARTRGEWQAPGYQYFCMATELKPCPGPTPRWHNVTKPKFASVFAPVFASGMPFPVFPDYPVQVESFAGSLVDGGYAHNVPLDAARVAQARQVLVVHSSPRAPDILTEEPDGFLSRLARNSLRLIPFMFEQSQEVDKATARTMLVASVAPSTCDGLPFPPLTDFRGPTISRLMECAAQDIREDKRIGRIESWGEPRLLRRLTPAAGALH